MKAQPKIYIGKETAKAKANFPFSFRLPNKEFIRAIVEIKRSSALAHFSAGELDRSRMKAILKACDEILLGRHTESFTLPAFQGGAGTSIHMNVNETIALRGTEILAKKGKKGIELHPNDHVNMSQSTNDVMPSALRLSALRMSGKLLSTLNILTKTLEKKSGQFRKIGKLGRTHLADAVPVTLGQEFEVYAEYVKTGAERIKNARRSMLELNLGGSAVGNSLNVSPRYIRKLYAELRKATGFPFRPAKNLMRGTSSQTDFLALSQSLTALCVDLSKMASDIRLMSSGPKGGFGEIVLPPLQAGSSIMPGKINPILPEAVNQLYFLVSGNTLAIEQAAASAELELGVMLPLIVDRLLESLRLADEVIGVFTIKCVAGIKADPARCRDILENSLAYATLLVPAIGYDKVEIAVKHALVSGKTLREAVVVDKKFLTDKKFDHLMKA